MAMAMIIQNTHVKKCKKRMHEGDFELKISVFTQKTWSGECYSREDQLNFVYTDSNNFSIKFIKYKIIKYSINFRTKFIKYKMIAYSNYFSIIFIKYKIITYNNFSIKFIKYRIIKYNKNLV